MGPKAQKYPLSAKYLRNTDADVADLTGVFMSAFEHGRPSLINTSFRRSNAKGRTDPIGFMFHGVQMKDDPELWRIHCKEDIIAGLQSGRVVVSRSEAGEIVAGAVCYGPGQNTPEKAATEDWQNRLDSMPPQQAAFLAKVSLENLGSW